MDLEDYPNSKFINNSRRNILSSNRYLIDVPEQIEDEIQGSFTNSLRSRERGMTS